MIKKISAIALLTLAITAFYGCSKTEEEAAASDAEKAASSAAADAEKAAAEAAKEAEKAAGEMSKKIAQ